MNASDFNSKLMNDVFENVKEAIVCSELTAYCQILAGIFSLAYIGNIFWKSWGKGQELHIVDLVKPFVVFFCITNFNLVTGLLDTLIYDPLNNGTTKLVENNNNVMTEVANYLKAIEERQPDNLLEAAKQWFEDSYNKLFKFPRIIFMSVFNILAQILCVIAKTCMIAYSYLLRILLTVFGPIAFALSLIPYFSDNIKNWMSKYIGALLYVPLCNIILYATQCFATTMFQLNQWDLTKKQLDDTAEQLKDLSTFHFHLDILTSDLGVAIMFIVSACAYFTVPKLAGMIVSMGDYGSEIGIGKAVTTTASQAGAVAAGVATGGASLAALGNGSFLQSMGTIINAFKNKGGDSAPGGSDAGGKGNSGVKGDG